MNRLQKKCVFAATGFHLLLLVILFVGPAFLTSSRENEDRPLIDFIPLKTIDQALAGGGNPHARPPAPTPPPPVRPVQPPTPQVQPTVQPPEPPKPVLRREPDAPDAKPERRLPDVSLTPVVRRQTSSARSSSQPKAADDRQRQFDLAVRSAARSIRDGLSSSTEIEMPGPGGGGVPYANFYDAVKKIYSDAWMVPDGVTDDEATVTASVIIARDGTVRSSRIIRRSGNSLVDASVEMTLRRVTYAAPLPDGARESERTVTIKFNVKAKRGLG